MSDASISPRLLSSLDAAAYCGVGQTLFLRECPLKPIRLGDRKLWDVRAIDAWIDTLCGVVKNVKGQVGATNATDEAIDRLNDAAAKKKKSRRRNQARNL